MKINVEFDMTPDEFRKVMGLPDVQVFQKEMMETIIQKMQTGEDGYDPFTLFQPFMESGINSVDSMKKMFMNMMGGSADKNGA
jgi:hypothetical protein